MKLFSVPFEFPSPLRDGPHSRFSSGDDDTANLSPVLSTSRKCPLCDSTGTRSDETLSTMKPYLLQTTNQTKQKV